MNKKRITVISLLLFWLCVIYFFSNMTGVESRNKSINTIDYTLTNIVKVTNNIGITNYNDNDILVLSKKLNYPLRKCMHVTEYFVLSIIIYILLGLFKMEERNRFLFIIILCFLYACSDEIHQLFTERTSKFTDVLIDTSGSILAIILINIKNYIILKLKNKKSILK